LDDSDSDDSDDEDDDEPTDTAGVDTIGQTGVSATGNDEAEADIFNPKMASELTKAQKRAALEYLMYLKQKRCGRIKARGCADGRKQRLYKTKEETSSPTVTTEALFITSTIDAEERRKIATVDIPGAFMHADMDELVHVRLSGPMAALLVRVDPEKYRKYVGKDKKGNETIYVELTKALYGTCQAALLFWKNLSTFLVEELGFTLNKYDKCVANKMIDGKQCTIVVYESNLNGSNDYTDSCLVLSYCCFNNTVNLSRSVVSTHTTMYCAVGADTCTIERGRRHARLGASGWYWSGGLFPVFCKGGVEREMSGIATSIIRLDYILLLGGGV
jgi:hypothetical protein